MRLACAGLGAVFATDETMPNPYDTLPAYWDELVAAAAAAPPRPSSVCAVL